MGAYDMILHKPGRMMRGSRSHCKIAGLLSSFRLRCSSNAESLKTLLRKGAHWSIEGMHFKGVAAFTSCSIEIVISPTICITAEIMIH